MSNYNQQTVTAGNYSSTVNLYFTYDQNSPRTSPNSQSQGNASTSFAVTATVPTTCTVSAGNLNFGTVGILASNVNASSTITANCTNGGPYNIGLNAGTAPGATVTTRQMTNGAATVGYALYSNAGMTTNWGNTVGTDTVGGTGTSNNQSYTVWPSARANHPRASDLQRYDRRHGDVLSRNKQSSRLGDTEPFCERSPEAGEASASGLL